MFKSLFKRRCRACRGTGVRSVFASPEDERNYWANLSMGAALGSGYFPGRPVRYVKAACECMRRVS